MRLLFVCTENSNRSQMAEAFARGLGGPSVSAYSAGSAPSGKVSPKALQAMAELGYDLSSQRSTSITEIPTGSWDAVVTMGCGDACPHVPARLHVDWDLEDPRDLDWPDYLKVRDDIGRRVRLLIEQLGNP